MGTRSLQRFGLVLAGLVLGLLLLAFAAWLYLRIARVEEVRTRIAERIQLPADAFRIDVVEEEAIRITLRNLVLEGIDGDTIVVAPYARLWLDVPSLVGDGPIDFYDVELERPLARFVQRPDTWNIFEVMRTTVDGAPLEDPEGRPLRFRDITVRDGEMVVAILSEPPPEDGFATNLQIPYAQIGGQWYQAYTARSVDAQLPLFLLAGDDGWRIELATATAALVEPALAFAAGDAWAQAEGEDGVRFDLGSLAIGGSQFAAEGLVRFTDPDPTYDVRVRAAPFLLADLQPLLPTLPEEGVAEFALAVQTQPDRRTLFDFEALSVVALDSEVRGSIAFLVAEGAFPVLADADLLLDPLELTALERLGLVEQLPVLGQVTGTLATEDAPGRIWMNLAATLVPRDEPGAEPSRILASGALVTDETFQPMRLDAVQLSFEPLRPATFAALAPEQRERLRGTVRGVVTLSGTTERIELEGGDLTYLVGGAPPTRLTGFAGFIAPDPLAYDLRATAQPLALGTLTELFPALPFQAATVTGPLRVAGDATALELSANLAGPAGGIQIAGEVAFEEPARFDVSGQVQAFAPMQLIRADLPPTGPMTGTFAFRGTTEDVRFEVDLTQALGAFELAGRVRFDAEPPIFEAAGRLEDFRLGTLLGQPALFPAPMTGPIEVSGGGGLAYRFDVDLRGPGSILDVAGHYLPGPVPTYSLAGEVAGIDLRRIPMFPGLPQTNLVGTVALEGQGTTLETLAGWVSLDAPGSQVAGLPLDVARLRAEVANGILRVDTASVVLANTRLDLQGMWGLIDPAPEPLRFSLSAPDLGVLRPLAVDAQGIRPQMTGSLVAAGEVGGSIRFPVVAGTATGRGLRFDAWRAATLDLTVDASRDPAFGWAGQAFLAATELQAPGIEPLQALRLEVGGTEAELAFGLFARRDARTDLAVSGLLDVEGLEPRGVALQVLTLRLDDAAWALAAPTSVRWGDVDGFRIENLLLEREDGVGLIAVDGVLPATGTADLRVSAVGIDLGDLRRLLPNAPELEGTLAVEAFFGGTVADPEMRVQGSLDGFALEEGRADRILFNADYVARRLEGDLRLILAERELAVAELSVPMSLSYEQFVPTFELLSAEPLSVRVVADSLPLGLASAFVPALAQGAGMAQAEIAIGGTIDEPTLQGWAEVERGALTIVPAGVRFTEIDSRVELVGNRVQIERFTARSLGAMAASGFVQFVPGGSPVVNLGVTMNRFRFLNDPDVATLTGSCEVVLAGAFPSPVLRGRLVLEESTIRVPELDEPTGLEIADVDVGQIGPDTPPELALGPMFLQDLRIEAFEVVAGESVWLASRDARVQITGDLILFRTGQDLRIFGLLQAVRGQYTFRIGTIAREFDIVSGRVQFFGTGELNPSIDITASHRVRPATAGPGADLNILVNLTGTLYSPRIELTSDTPARLSESGLISYLLFGRPSFELGGIGGLFAEQLLVQEVLGGILATELERPILEAGLCDYVRVQPGVTTFARLFRADLLTTLGAATIECGRELTENLFLTVESGIGPLFGDRSTLLWGVGLEWQIDREWMWELSYGPVRRDPLMRLLSPDIRYQLSTDIRRSWEYGGSRIRSPLAPPPGAEPEPEPETAPPPPPPPGTEPEPEPETAPPPPPAPPPARPGGG